MKCIRSLLVSIFALVAFSHTVHAAVLSVVPSQTAVGVGDTLTVTVVLDSVPENVNAVQATLEFPSNVFSYISEDRSKSVFNFWVQEPVVEDNKISFIGGTPAGVTGSGLKVLTFTMKAKGSGAALLTLNDALVTANDGEGTNVLKEIKSASVTVGLTVGKTSLGTTTASGGSTSATSEITPAVVAAPKLIARTAEVAQRKPSAPKLELPLYPEEDRWYNNTGDLTVFWDVPADVSAVAVVFDNVASTVPSRYEPELYDGKKVGTTKEGVSYVHVRYKNSEGQGPVTHRKIQIDTTSPLPFTIKSSDGPVSENPSPTLNFEAQDELSGIDHYEIQIDTQDVFISEEPVYELPPQRPGKKVVVVTAIDKAGNQKQWFYNLEILPIAAPTISGFEGKPYVGEGNFIVRGTALANALINAQLKDQDAVVAGEVSAVADGSGNWELVFNEALKYGEYTVEVVAQDERGASSLPVVSDPVKVRVRPIVVIGGIGLTPNVFFSLLILLILALVFFAGLSYWFWKQQVGRRVVIAQRDVTGAFDAISKDVDEMLAVWSHGKVTKGGLTSLQTRLQKTSENIAKLKKYITQNVGGISR